MLVGHSSGGGLSQFVLSSGDATVTGLALLAAIPGSGSREINSNPCMAMDLWFIPRMFFYLGHPMSPLDFTALVKQALFCTEYPLQKAREIETRMPKYESFLWRLGYTFRFATYQNVLQLIVGGTSRRLVVIAGEKDRLVTTFIAKKLASDYGDAEKHLVAEKKLDIGRDEASSVQYLEVKGAGHHFQNDLQ
ncbi:hypothetical protein BT63DRAFT_408958 [Microthyrium microscopicum]|uniref:AB hydrolase-1 domain-containing protein n=1 Tax=Microthyrium microscopicum TaxID=703497 RepID=A0A6A6UTN7_9PEZI|nr:hypothetical protein BT63DRAFT_408958 [Microthyrium microscopicum]